jgi:hypothetical protein
MFLVEPCAIECRGEKTGGPYPLSDVEENCNPRYWMDLFCLERALLAQVSLLVTDTNQAGIPLLVEFFA